MATATEILDEGRADQRNEVAAISRHIHRAMVNARDVGAVTDFIWSDIGGQRIPIDLDRLTANALRRLQKMRMKLGSCKAAKARLEWFKKNGDNVHQDVIEVAHAFVSLYRFEAMWLAHAARKYANDESERPAIANYHEQTRSRLVEMRDTLAPLIEVIWRHLSIVAECPGSRGWDIHGVRHARSEVAGMANRLRAPMADLYQMISGVELKNPPAPEVQDKGFAPLRWLLDADEEVKMHGTIKSLRKNRVLIATTQRVLVLNQGDFQKTGAIESEHPLEHCRIGMSEQTPCRVNIWKTPDNIERRPDYTLDFPSSKDCAQRLQRAVRALFQAHIELVASKHPAHSLVDRT